jgi:hypothetical protein
MAHLRQQIRDAIETTLTGLTTTGSNVFIQRTEPLETSKLPALVISTPTDERTGFAGMGPPRTFIRELTVQIEAYAHQSNVVDLLDTIAAEVETAICADPTLGGLCKDLFITSSEMSLSGESAQPSGINTMQFTVIYHHRENTPETALT